MRYGLGHPRGRVDRRPQGGTDGTTKGLTKMLRGDVVYLTPLDPANMEVSRGWINDPEVHRWLLAGHIPVSKPAQAAFYAHMEASQTDHIFEIHVAETGAYIGNVALNDIDIRHGHAEVSIVVGVTSEQNKGYGRDAIRTILRYGFGTLRLHRIEIRASRENERAVHLYRSIGFKDAGVLRQHTFVDGAYEDEAVLDMLEGEWAELA